VQEGEQAPPADTGFAAFASKDFFSYEGRWALDKRASGKRLSPRQCLEKRRTFDKHVIPILGQMKLHEINRAVLKDFRNAMYQDGYSGSTINRALDCIRAVLEAAEDENRIDAVPRIDRAASRPTERGIPTTNEFHGIFAARWEDPRAYYASALAAVTGCRMGEILALRLSNIDSVRLLVSVERSYDSAERVICATTKNGKSRMVTIPPMVCHGLEMLATANPHTGVDPLVFWSEKTPDRPCDYKLVTRGLYRALTQIGIDAAERRRRHLSFHSWRHWLNSQLVEAHVPPEKIRMLTGHSSSEMTLLYYHTQLEAMADVQDVQARMLKNCLVHTRRQQRVVRQLLALPIDLSRRPPNETTRVALEEIMIGDHMSDSDFSLDFEKIESYEVSLDLTARGQICLLCVQFIGEARLYHRAPPFDAEAARSKARTINRKATAAKKALRELSVCSHDAAEHDFYLFYPDDSNSYLFSVKKAIRLVRRIAQAAEKKASESYPVGRPELQNFKNLVRELYRIYLGSGGKGKITWDKNRKCYRGYPIFFIKRVIEQIRPYMPEPVLKKFLPEKESAVSRTATEAIRNFEKEESKNGGEKQLKIAVFMPYAKFDTSLDPVIRCPHEHKRNICPVH